MDFSVGLQHLIGSVSEKYIKDILLQQNKEI
jgi:hypothetical protein